MKPSDGWAEGWGAATDRLTVFLVGLYLFMAYCVTEGYELAWLLALAWGKLGQMSVPVLCLWLYGLAIGKSGCFLNHPDWGGGASGGGR